MKPHGMERKVLLQLLQAGNLSLNCADLAALCDLDESRVRHAAQRLRVQGFATTRAVPGDALGNVFPTDVGTARAKGIARRQAWWAEHGLALGISFASLVVSIIALLVAILRP